MCLTFDMFFQTLPLEGSSAEDMRSTRKTPNLVGVVFEFLEAYAVVNANIAGMG